MQVPSEKVPVARCLALAGYSERMLGKFPLNTTLAALSGRMRTNARSLEDTEALLTRRRAEIVLLRVDLRFEDYSSDGRVRRTFKLAEIVDGRSRGRLSSQLFPDGLKAITRRFGEKQIEYMIDLELRLDAVVDIWPEAAAERDAVAEHRARYQAALQARTDKENEIRSALTARNAARVRFVEQYAEIAHRVKAEFPGDKVTPELFFDKVRTRAAAAATSVDGETGEGTGDAPAEPAPETIPATA